MDWPQTLGIVIGNAAIIVPLFLWNRSESRADTRHLDGKLEMWRTETHSILNAIKDEMKDFHGRLCAIEERNRQS